MAETKKYYDELNIYRALITFWVVIGHSFDSDRSVLGFLHEYAYTFHMSAFFVLSGFLFKSKLQKSKSLKSKASVIANRFNRLIIPYFFFTAISYVLKMFLENYANNPLSKHNIIIDTIMLYDNPNGGIWFLYALFFISVLGILLCNLPIWSLFTISLGLKVVSFFYTAPIPAVIFIMAHSVFFYAGAFIALYYDKISVSLKTFTEKKKGFITLSLITALLLVISFTVSYYAIYIVKSDVLSAVIKIFNIIVWYFAALVVDKIKPLKNINMVLGDYGMDIYMIGYYVQITIRVVFKSMLGAPYILYSVMMCVFGLLLPIPISKYIVRKFRITRALMLGDFSKKNKKKDN